MIESDLANELLNYGVLGIVCIILIVAIYKMWRHLLKREEECAKNQHIRDKAFLERTDRFTEVMNKYAVNDSTNTEVMRSLTKAIDKLTDKIEN